MARLFWGPLFFIFDIKGYLFIYLIYCCYVSECVLSLICRNKFCKSEDYLFLLHLFKASMKLRFLFSSLSLSHPEDTGVP